MHPRILTFPGILPHSVLSPASPASVMYHGSRNGVTKLKFDPIGQYRGSGGGGLVCVCGFIPRGYDFWRAGFDGLFSKES